MSRFFRRRRAPASFAHSVDDLTRRNVEAIARIERKAEVARPRAERYADFIARGVGSWRFVAIQSAVLAFYMGLNAVAWMRHWDPYPFILLNLILNIQAAYTGPVIMMSQNRQSKIDERRNHLDLQINLLAEQENTEMLRLLRKLCEKTGIPVDDRPTVKGMEQPTRPESLLRQIEQIVAEQAALEREKKA